MSSKNAIKSVSRAFSSMATHHHMSPNKVVLSDFVNRMLPNLSLKQRATELPQQQVAKTMFHSEPAPLDPRDYGYRVVAAVDQAPLYTSTVISQPENQGTTYTLGRIICNDEMMAEEVMAAQREWDAVLDMEPTRPHFEYYKEDPYNQFESSRAVQELFSCIDGDTEDVWEAAA